MKRGRPQEPNGERKSRTLVLVATMRSPTIGSLDQTDIRAHPRQRVIDLGERPHPIFPHARASPEGDHITDIRGLVTAGRTVRLEWFAGLMASVIQTRS